MSCSTTNYNYENIWLYITTTGPECNKEKNKKSILGKVPVEIKIAKPNGEWIGEKSGTYIETQLLFRERKFCKGEYTFTIEQGVTMDVMPEVSDITIEVKHVLVILDPTPEIESSYLSRITGLTLQI